MTGHASSTVLATSGLSAGYDGVAVVHDLDLRVAAGEVVALLGPNGAGKTTTLLTISGLLPRLGGSIEVLGLSLRRRRRPRVRDVWSGARRGVAHVPEDRGLFFDLTARQNLRLAGAGRRGRSGLRGLPVAEVLSRFPALEPVLDRRAGLLSGGEQQLLALARAVAARPKLLLVDEMSLGLAPIIVERLLPELRSVAADTGAGVLLVEQHIGLALEISDRAYVLTQGRVTASGTSEEVRNQAERLEASYLGQ